jgi:hypothetical protein
MKKNLSFLLLCLFVAAIKLPTAGQSQSLKIILDYRFDGGYFSRHPSGRCRWSTWRGCGRGC